MQPRIFQIGFNRCGTKTLSEFFKANGVRTAHWKRGTIACGIELARRQGKPLLTYVDRFQAFTDMERIRVPALRRWWVVTPTFRRLVRELGPEENAPIYAYKYFAPLHQQYPGSRFILNSRPVDKWVASRLRFMGGLYRSCIHGDHAHGSDAELGKCWKRDWADHHASVRSYFADHPDDLLVFDIEADDPTRLVEFLKPVALDLQHWKHINATAAVATPG